MAKLWKDKTLRERVEVRLTTLANVMTEIHPWGEKFWLTASKPEVLIRALENLKKVPDFALENMDAVDSEDGVFAFEGGEIDTLMNALWKFDFTDSELKNHLKFFPLQSLNDCNYMDEKWDSFWNAYYYVRKNPMDETGFMQL